MDLKKAEELDRLAAQLGLTTRQRAWCEWMEAHVGFTAIEGVRAIAPDANNKSLIAQRLSDSIKCQRYRLALQKGVEAAERIGVTATSIATARELLERMSTRGRTSAADFVKFKREPPPLMPVTNGNESAEVAPEGEYVRDPDGRLVEDFQLDLRSAFERGLGVCIKSISFDRDGRPRIEFVDAMAADVQLGKWIGLEKQSPEEPEEVRQARAMIVEVIKNPEHARALENVSLEVERVKLTMNKG